MRVAIPPTIDPAAFARQRAEVAIGSASGRSMGTTWRVRATGASTGAITAIVVPVLDRVVAQMSHWSARSTLSRFNGSPPGDWHLLEPGFATVIDAALAIARDSGGAFDPAAGALVDLWGFGPHGPCAPPDAAAVAQAAADGGWRALDWDPAMRRLRRRRPVRLDLSGIAKGFAVDAVCDALIAAGLPDHLVEIGGEVRGGGVRPDRQPWWVDAEPIPDLTTEPLRIAACDVAVATSGDYVRGAHTLDPATGRPIAHATAAVTVIHPRCCVADAWATALTVLPPVQARTIATDRQLPARIVERTCPATEWLSPALAVMLD